MHRALVLAWSFVLATPFEVAAQQSAPEFKTFKIVVGFSTGGAYETSARVCPPHEPAHPEQPRIAREALVSQWPAPCWSFARPLAAGGTLCGSRRHAYRRDSLRRL